MNNIDLYNYYFKILQYTLFQALESTGLRPTSDPRLKEMVQNIQKYQNQIETTQDITELVIGRSEFKE